ncbi:MAG: hypothetical protein HOC23_11170 [Halieaceae bacterium]|jgi:hypothetical protein|nr:hypothetical protein [Halieaceae bacterium]
MKKIIAPILLLCLLTPIGFAQPSAGVIQTQMSLDANFEIDVKKAQVINNVLTIVFVFRNTSGSKAKISMAPSEIYYIDPTQNKKYHILKDEKGTFIMAPTLFYGKLEFQVEAGKMKLAWIKMPAPDADVETININLPGSLPFEELKISR